MPKHFQDVVLEVQDSELHTEAEVQGKFVLVSGQ